MALQQWPHGGACQPAQVVQTPDVWAGSAGPLTAAGALCRLKHALAYFTNFGQEPGYMAKHRCPLASFFLRADVARRSKAAYIARSSPHQVVGIHHAKRFDVDEILYQHCVKKLLVG